MLKQAVLYHIVVAGEGSDLQGKESTVACDQQWVSLDLFQLFSYHKSGDTEGACCLASEATQCLTMGAVPFCLQHRHVPCRLQCDQEA